MRSRLDDLIVTADRQLASRSYDAAIDTLRTASGEPGAMEAGVEDRLAAVCRARDKARGIVRSAPPPAPAVVEIAPIVVEPAVIAVVTAAKAVEIAPIAAEPVVEVQVAPEPVPEPAPPAVVDDRPIEAPRFLLVDDDPTMLERPEPEGYQRPLEVERLSILDPTPPPEPEIDPDLVSRIILAIGIFIVVFGLAYLLK